MEIHSCWRDVNDVLDAGLDRIILFGPPGTGKTYAALHLATPRGVERLTCTDDITSAEVNIQIAEYFGEAPANSKSCALAANPDHCKIFHAEETDYWKNVWYWTTPTEECLDGRTDATCVPYTEWVTAWNSLRS